HGESLGEHGELTHSLFVYDATQRVPAILAGPDVPVRIEPRQRALVDVTPTILDLFDVPPADDLPGESLLERPGPEAAYVETKSPELMRGWSPLHGLRTEEWKYIRAPRSELYDLRADPGESVNRILEQPDLAARFERDLSGRLAQSRSAGEDPSLDDETAARLRALGYVATIEPGTKADLRQDPKDGAEMVAALFRGEEAFQRRNFVVARRYLERAIELDPGSKEAHSFLAGTMVELSRWSAALEHAERALELPPHWNEAPLHTTAAEALLALGRPADAIPHLRRAMELAPRDEKAARLLARAEDRAR
ncbi:MAG: tetratricopeptide repeat protein, partial [Gemmatimonadetes bacterium]|nr:tetratricopeptide repeat protein [Gemmatimonadota bacterium]